MRTKRAIAVGSIIVVTSLVMWLEPRFQADRAAAATTTSVSGAQALQALDESSRSLRELVQIQRKVMQISQEQAQLYSELNAKVGAWTKRVQGDLGSPVSQASGGSSQAQLMQATQNMQETQMSFNLQYLGLQNQMQNENRQFTMVSNIMKTKENTVRNSIGNIR